MITGKLVLLTKQDTYFVEYLLGQLVLSDSISEAMIFETAETAGRFKEMLYKTCDLECSINTYIA